MNQQTREFLEANNWVVAKEDMETHLNVTCTSEWCEKNGLQVVTCAGQELIIPLPSSRMQLQQTKVELLHRYNDLKDMIEKCVGIIAEKTNDTAATVYQRLGIKL